MTKNEKETPDSVNARAKVKADDQAVRESLKTDSKHPTSVLPGPPIPPEIQHEIRNDRNRRDQNTDT